MCGTQQTTQNSSSSTTLPTWLTNAGQSVGTQATDQTATNPYQEYAGPTQANFGSTFNQAETGASDQASATNPSFTSGNAALTTGLNTAAATASAPVSSLMSQYTDAALQPTLQAIQTQAAANNSGIAQGATMAGAFGDTGDATQKALNDYNTTQAVGNATGTAYNNAYNTALTTQQNALGQLMTGVGEASGLGTATNNAGVANNTLLGNLGTTVQQAGQTGINTAVNVNNQNQLGQLTEDQMAASTLATVPKDTSTTGTSTTTSPDNTGWGLLGSAISAI